MNKNSLFLTLGLLVGSPFLTNCSKKDVISYYIDCDTTNVKTNYLVGDLFDPTNLSANLIKLINGKVVSNEKLFTFTLSIDNNTQLSLNDTEIYVLPPEGFVGECIPYKIDITINPPVYKLGEKVDFGSQYPGYSFESDKPFIGRVNRDGFLETFREGEFSLTGSHVGKQPVFINCVVKEDEDIKYDTYLATDTSAGNFMLELKLSPFVATKSTYLLEPSFMSDSDIKVRYEVSDPELLKVEQNPQGNYVLKTNSKTGSGRLKIYLDDENYSIYGNKLLYDYYVVVVSPFTPNEIKSYLSGTHWVSYALSGEKFALNFSANSANLSGIQENSLFSPYNFSFVVEQESVTLLDKVCAKFTCDSTGSTEDATTAAIMYVDLHFTQLFLYNRHERLISIFSLTDENMTH